VRKAAALTVFLAAVTVMATGTQMALADDGENLLTIDHYVSVRSTVPATAGQVSEIDVREKVRAGAALRGASIENQSVFSCRNYVGFLQALLLHKSREYIAGNTVFKDGLCRQGVLILFGQDLKNRR